jgi:hypothetical protein
MRILKRHIILLVFVFMNCYNTYTQHLSSARGISLGAFSSFAGSIGSLDWNPAGLNSLGSWEISLSNFTATGNQSNGIGVFNSIGIGKRFLENQAVAVQYSPGKELDFVFSSSFSIFDTAGIEVTAKFDQKISYNQNYSFGYSYLFSNGLSVGIGAHYFETKISDMRYRFDENNSIQSYTEDYTAQMWSIDLGLMTPISEHWSHGITIKNLFQFSEHELNQKFENYRLNLSKIVRFGFGYTGLDDFKIALDGDSKYHFQVGTEWDPYSWLQLRSSIYNSKWKVIDAVGVGFGIIYNPIRIDVAYLKFPHSGNRTNTISSDVFKSDSFVDIDYTAFTTDRLSLTATINLWQTRESLARIEYVEMLGEVFTASHQVYAFRPIGKARVKNISSKPIQAKVSFFVDEIMTAPTDTKSYTISPNEVIEIPFFAVFNELISAVKKFSIFDGTVFVNAETAVEYDDRYQTRVLVRSKNDWDGDPLSLRYFLTPNDPEIIKFSRDALSRNKNIFDSLDVVIHNFVKSKIIFNIFAEKLLYVHDPMTSKDFVQYPSETLSLHGGDCDDLTVSYASLLMSIGISVAIVDVVPPGQPDKAHIYLMFDSGVQPENGEMISTNPKKYIVRKNINGKETIWIPVETTFISKGFDEAWTESAQQYYENAELHSAIELGWLRIIDLPDGI